MLALQEVGDHVELSDDAGAAGDGTGDGEATAMNYGVELEGEREGRRVGPGGACFMAGVIGGMGQTGEERLRTRLR